MLKDLISPFKSGSFKALWIGQSFSRLGDSIMSVMLPLIVYSISGSALTMGIVMALNMIPQIILTPITGVLADRMSRKKLMIVSDIVRLITLSAISALSISNYQININIIYVYAVISGAMSSLFQPAYSAVRAEVFTEEIRNSANSLTQISEQFSRLIGPSIGALIISFSSIGIGFGLDALTFLISVVSLIFLKINKNIVQPIGNESKLLLFKNELVGGFNEIKKQEWLKVTIIVFSLFNIITTSFISILLPWLIKIYYKLPPYVYGTLITAIGIGSLFAAFIFSLRKRWKHRGIIVYTSYIILGITLCGTPFINQITYLIFVMITFGVIQTIFSLIWEGSLQELIPINSFGKVASLDMMGSYILLPIGYLITGWLTEYVGGIKAILYETIFLIISAVIPLLISKIRKFD